MKALDAWKPLIVAAILSAGLIVSGYLIGGRYALMHPGMIYDRFTGEAKVCSPRDDRCRYMRDAPDFSDQATAAR